jgi:tetratricopeptide (TPR) repeat protein
VADISSAALAAAGRFDEARRCHEQAPPIRPDYFFTLFSTFRAMTIVPLGDKEEAAELYEALLPYRGGPPAGLESLSVAMRPIDQTLGDLARLLGRTADAKAHFATAATIADRWSAAHWKAEALQALA